MISIDNLKYYIDLFENLINKKEKDNSDYLSYIFKIKLSFFEGSENHKDIINKIKIVKSTNTVIFATLIEKYSLDLVISYKELNVSYREHIKFRNTSKTRNINFLLGKTDYSEKWKMTKNTYDTILNFSLWIEEHIPNLISEINIISEKLEKYPIVETRETCIYILLIAKQIKLHKDVAKELAKKIWNTRYTEDFYIYDKHKIEGVKN